MATSHATLNEQQPGALEPVRAFNAPLGVVSPLWLAFMGAASAGVAFWWMSRWIKPFKAVSGADVEPGLEPVANSPSEAAPKTKAAPKAKTAARKSPPAIAARVSARTKRRQPADAAKGSPKRR